MNFLLLAVACFVSKAEDPLPFSGSFNTIYLAGKHKSVTAENSQMRILMREVKYFKQYQVMSMTFYVRKNGKCQLHTVWADKFYMNLCTKSWSSEDNRFGYNFIEYVFRVECPERNGTDSIPGLWILRDSVRHFPKIYYHPPSAGGVYRSPSVVGIEIHFASNSTILFEVQYINYLNYYQSVAGAMATGTNITEELWKEYMKLTQQRRIPTENIENVYERDTCPKWKP